MKIIYVILIVEFGGNSGLSRSKEDGVMRSGNGSQKVKMACGCNPSKSSCDLCGETKYCYDLIHSKKKILIYGGRASGKRKWLEDRINLRKKVNPPKQGR